MLMSSSLPVVQRPVQWFALPVVFFFLAGALPPEAHARFGFGAKASATRTVAPETQPSGRLSNGQSSSQEAWSEQDSKKAQLHTDAYVENKAAAHEARGQGQYFQARRFENQAKIHATELKKLGN